MAECNETTTSKTMIMMNMKAAMQIVRKSYTGNILFSSITIIEGIIIIGDDIRINHKQLVKFE